MMRPFTHLATLTTTFATLFAVVCGVPTWDMFSSRDSIGSLVPGSTLVEVLGPMGAAEAPLYLGSAATKGAGGDIIVGNHPTPDQFYVDPRGNLFQSINETTILYVNVMNTSTANAAELGQKPREPLEYSSQLHLHDNTPAPPLKLVLGTRREGLTAGKWRWQGTLLFYELPSMFSFRDGRVKGTNQGLFYNCHDKLGARGLYMFLEPTQTPIGCHVVTLHSFGGVKRGEAL